MSQTLILPTSANSHASESCKQCRFSTIEQGDRVCRRMPPQASIIMVPAKIAGSFMPQPFCTFPLVRDDQWCGCFETRDRLQ